MRILITGSTGFVGKALTIRLLEEKHEVTVLTTNPVRAKVLFGDQVGCLSWMNLNLSNIDAVIHLAGAGVADQRWSELRKREIYDSRIKTTRQLVEAMTKMTAPPKTFICASAVGYYGEGGEEALRETAPAGNDFLAKVCVDWEAAARELLPASVRLVNLRIGVVLGKGGGILDKMMTPFKWGVGGRLGSGRQWFPWIHLDDLVEMMVFALTKDSLRGPVNGVGPAPVTNRDFSASLGRALSRPAVLPVPAAALSAMMGELGKFALCSQRVIPAAALAEGFRFRYGSLDDALRQITGGFSDDSFKLRFTQLLPVAPKILFEFFSDAKNLERLTPPEMHPKVTKVDPPQLGLGACLDLRVRNLGIPLSWRSQIVEWEPPHSFCDIQLRGPFRLWRHHHLLQAQGEGTEIIDDLEFQLPLGGLGNWLAGKKVQRDIEKLFTYRQDVLAGMFNRGAS